MSEVAVIISLYCNVSSEHFRASIESLVKQTFQVDLFLKIDGEIPPQLADMVESYCEEGVFTYVDYREKNLGLGVSLNELLLRVLERGYEYIARMDTDDIAVLNRFEVQYDFMQSHRDIDVVGGYIEEFGDDFIYNKKVMYPLTHNEMFVFFSKRVPLPHVTAFFRKSFFLKAGMYPTSTLTNEDTLLWMHGFKNGCLFANIPKVLVRVRVSKAFFSRRGGLTKSWSDFKDRILVIRTLGYNNFSYIYAGILFLINIAPARIKQFLYRRLR